MRKLWITMAVALLAGALTMTGCSKEKNPASTEILKGEAGLQTPLEEDSEAETIQPLLGEFTTLTLEGEEVGQEIFSQAELTMLNIWGTFCGPCIREMPELGELAEEYAGQLQIIGLISDVVEAGDETAQEIIEYTGADYMHILNSADLNSAYLNQVQQVPTTVFLDKEGKQVGETYAGAKNKEKWEAVIQEVMEIMENE